MGDSAVHISGELNSWPSKHELATILQAAGLSCAVGKFSIRVEDCSHFVFQEYGRNLGVPQIEADADSLDQMLRDAGLVSAALCRVDLKHRFEIYDANNNRIGYLHHRWPLNDGT